jgi:hypothetical protein
MYTSIHITAEQLASISPTKRQYSTIIETIYFRQYARSLLHFKVFVHRLAIPISISLHAQL